jgi:ATP-binding cassette subfamily A (ABC1) protein 3
MLKIDMHITHVGLPKDKVKGEVEEMITVLNLLNKRNTASKTLSGGMKRKLSIVIALIAGSNVFRKTF